MVKRYSTLLLSATVMLTLGTGSALAKDSQVPFHTTESQATKGSEQSVAPLATGSLQISWSFVLNVDHFKVSVRDMETGQIVIEHQQYGVATKNITLSGLNPHQHQIWVGAFDTYNRKLKDGITQAYVYGGSTTSVKVELN
ncbi:hypothetical protein [Paenibacillus alvei]|uniref:hypothetical protein n=1 Tax=Paenibacillus alvei TaxID=44250 RepID=UPI0013D9BCBF|nr:hypothetical protein [Paenibacillus alvei]MBG9733849.1 hypothetical protein [Paenibacillus alvei]MBG9743832.1 hypothetical protein [Paenibacillus alvei]MCY9580300.1 hypothetical protein [Paenibacillus alvei]MCY9583374.1 hypothetical protein [Paenibacillus alvei]NEZ44940.1 hypothetical protein [Paenibacillus alvei]